MKTQNLLFLTAFSASQTIFAQDAGQEIKLTPQENILRTELTAQQRNKCNDEVTFITAKLISLHRELDDLRKKMKPVDESKKEPEKKG